MAQPAASGFRFTVLGHAALLVECHGVSVLCDPWLVGSCYWRSWWNLPEPPSECIDGLQPDAIYLTHLHWDHFHGPSLRRFARDTRIYLPEAPTTRMRRDLEAMRFTDIVEIPHGAHVALADDFRLWSYQFGPFFIDSAAVFEGAGVTLFNANDCKFFGLPLRQIRRRHPRMDFVLRSHSSASPFPYCLAGYPERWAEERSPADYIEEFCRFCLHVGARHAIPFASNHCYLHRETLAFNALAVAPDRVQARYAELAADLGADSDCRLMPPGTAWSQAQGFDPPSYDYARREESIAAMQHSHGDRLQAQYRLEEATRPDFDAFQSYFQAFFDRVPRWLRRLMGCRVRFVVEGGGERARWLLDIPAGRIQRDGAEAASAPVEIHIAALVLRDCCRKRLFSMLGASKRLRVGLASGVSPRSARGLLSLLDLYENDAFPLWQRRHLRVWVRRWREMLSLVAAGFAVMVLRRPMRLEQHYPLRVGRVGRDG